MIFNTHYLYIGGGGGVPKFTYTGRYTFIDDGNGNWRIKFLTSGVITWLKDTMIDVFLVGAGGGGKSESPQAGGGGGAMYAYAVKKVAGVSMLGDLGAAEAVWHLDVVDFRGVVAMDAHGCSLFDAVRETSQKVVSSLVQQELGD